MQYIISKITNHICWIDYLQMFGLLTVFVWKIWIGVGTIIRMITIFLLLNKQYEILLSSGCQKLWMYEPRRACVSYQRQRGGCSYLLTCELVQTQVDVDMAQTPLKQLNIHTCHCILSIALFSYVGSICLNINLSLYLEFFLKSL